MCALKHYQLSPIDRWSSVNILESDTLSFVRCAKIWQSNILIGGMICVRPFWIRHCPLSSHLANNLYHLMQVTPCKISGGLSAQMSWSKTQGEVHEETLTWSVDSLVKVNKKQTAWAALVVNEENIDVEFEVFNSFYMSENYVKFMFTVKSLYPQRQAA